MKKSPHKDKSHYEECCVCVPQETSLKECPICKKLPRGLMQEHGGENYHVPCLLSSLKVIPGQERDKLRGGFTESPALSLEWDWEKEFEKKFPPWIAMEKYVGLRPEILEFIHKVESNALARGREEGNKSCPPHNFIPYHFVGGWGGSVPPPNMKCTKCLSEQYF